MILFKLTSVYEVMVNDQAVSRPVRIEIFQSTEDLHIYRSRVWVRNKYNVYPMALNTGPKGEDLHKIHSSDDLINDISLILAEDESLYNGKHFESEKQILEYTMKCINKYFGGNLT